MARKEVDLIMRPSKQMSSMSRGRVLRSLFVLAAVGAVALVVSGAGAAPRGAYRQVNLISDLTGVARITDPNLVNPWGLAAGSNTPLWVADNGTDSSTLYTGGVNGSIPKITPLVVKIPGGAPTGLVFNSSSDFMISRGGTSAPAAFIFDSEAGKLTAFSPKVPPLTKAVTVFSRSSAIYKGLAIATSSKGSTLYATDFHNGRVDVFDKSFKPTSLAGRFKDPGIPKGYGPFGIQELNGKLYVTYAKQDAKREDDDHGPGRGFVDVFDNNGHMLKRLISRGALNSPWGLVIAPSGFGPMSGQLLVGNFGDGAIHAYDANSGAPKGALTNTDGNPIAIDGLWALQFGNGVMGTPKTLLFTAGIGDESHGLFGEITAG
jgi:uncharacterized protein (TIGR03118 family)